MTPFERADAAARQYGEGKCKTWRRGFRYGWLGMPNSTIIGEKVTVAEAGRFAEGYEEGRCDWERQWTAAADASAAAIRASIDAFRRGLASIDATLKRLHQENLQRAIAEHDRGVAAYHEVVEQRRMPA